ncbi:hypothetical protein WA026_021615 [Henosepilachna vigintioctopunctata]|uniref:Uncharacterized protein n=1 Tax=Henosepilachna vigintioctopunctata TaxID=420089 RepID=A0AAW1UXZ5_9CUCU
MLHTLERNVHRKRHASNKESRSNLVTKIPQRAPAINWIGGACGKAVYGARKTEQQATPMQYACYIHDSVLGESVVADIEEFRMQPSATASIPPPGEMDLQPIQSMDWLFKKERIYLLAQFWQQVSKL